MRTALSMSICMLLLPGCLFPSFDHIQGGERPKDGGGETTDSTPTEVTSKTVDVTADASTEAQVAAPVSHPSVDASADAAAKAPPTITCGASECPVAAGSYCCAGYSPPKEHACERESGQGSNWCVAGVAHALFCDERSDCAAGQFCVHRDDLAGGIARCEVPAAQARVLCKSDDDCPNGRKCSNATVDDDVSNRVCAP